jgi:hypothetical protein
VAAVASEDTGASGDGLGIPTVKLPPAEPSPMTVSDFASEISHELIEHVHAPSSPTRLAAHGFAGFTAFASWWLLGLLLIPWLDGDRLAVIHVVVFAVGAPIVGYLWWITRRMVKASTTADGAAILTGRRPVVVDDDGEGAEDAAAR